MQVILMQKFAPRLNFLSNQKNQQKHIDMPLFAFYLYVYFCNKSIYKL